MNDLRLHPIEVDTGSADREGRLILRGDRLVGLLVRLADEEHGEARGCWHIEAMFDGRSGSGALFPTLAEAERQLRQWSRAGRECGAAAVGEQLHDPPRQVG